MSAATVLLHELAERGIRVEPRPGGKLFVAPKARVTPEVIEKIQQNKPALLAALGAEATSVMADIKSPALAVLEGDQLLGRAREVAQWCEEHRIDVTIGAAILAIETDAFRLGWSPRRLWGFRFGPIQERGLAALLDAGDHLKLRSDHIEITKADGNTQRFWLHEA